MPDQRTFLPVSLAAVVPSVVDVIYRKKIFTLIFEQITLIYIYIIGILHEGSIQTWLLPEGLAKIMPEPEGWGHYFLPSPRAIIMFVWTLSVVFLLLHVFDYFETFLKWIIFFIFWLITSKITLLIIATFVTLTHNLTKQWRCNNYFNVTITIVLVTSQKRHGLVSEIAGVFSGRAILEIIAREGHTKHVIALCFQPIKTLDFTSACNIYIYIYINIQLTKGHVNDINRY